MSKANERLERLENETEAASGGMRAIERLSGHTRDSFGQTGLRVPKHEASVEAHRHKLVACRARPAVDRESPAT